MKTCCICHKKKAIKNASKCNPCGIKNRVHMRTKNGFNKRSESGRGRPTKYNPTNR